MTDKPRTAVDVLKEVYDNDSVQIDRVKEEIADLVRQLTEAQQRLAAYQDDAKEVAKGIRRLSKAIPFL